MNLHLVILLYSENTGCLDYLGEKSLVSVEGEYFGD